MSKIGVWSVVRSWRYVARWAVLCVAGMGLTAMGQTMPDAGALPASMPAGHPQIEGAAPATMPAGHPAIGDMSPASMPAGLPSGHPTIEQMMAAKGAGGAGTQATSMPANPHGAAAAMGAPQGATGSLEVHVLQGTPGGPAIVPGKVQLTWLHPTMTFKPREAQMNESGVARFEGMAVDMVKGLEGMLTFAHAGVDQTLGDIHVTPENPNLKMDFPIYETTTEKPKWVIALRHVDVLEWNKEAAHIQDKYTVRSPGDKIWLGTGEAAKRVTMAFALPMEVEQLGSNIAGAQTRLERGSLVTGVPVFPGERIYSLDYSLPVKDGELRLALKSAMDVERVLVHVPADGSKVTATGLTFKAANPEDGESQVREYVAGGMAAGSTAELVMGGTEAAGKSAWSAKNVAIGGAFLLALVAVGMMLMKKPKNVDKVKG